MATGQTISGGGQFPEGISVGAYPRSAWGAEGVFGAPTGSPTNTQTVTNGKLAFTGLADNTDYIAYAQVSGQDRFRRFSTREGTVAATENGTGRLSARPYQLVADERRLTNGAMTSGLATLTSTGANFSGQDVGKSIVVIGAGAAGAALKTTIASRESATQVTLAANAGTTVAGAAVQYGTPAGAAINTMLTAAAANALAAGTDVTVEIPGGRFLIETPILYRNGVHLVGQGASTVFCQQWATTMTVVQPNSPYENSYGLRRFTVDGGRDYQTVSATAVGLTRGVQLVTPPTTPPFLINTPFVSGGDQPLVQDIIIAHVLGSGIGMDNNISGLKASNIFAFNCSIHGFDIAPADSDLDGLTAGACGQIGIRIAGANNRGSLWKAYSCGMAGSNQHAIHVAGNKLTLLGFEIQETYAYGLYVQADDFTGVGLVDGVDSGRSVYVEGKRASIDVVSRDFQGRITANNGQPFYHLEMHPQRAVDCDIKIRGTGATIGFFDPAGGSVYTRQGNRITTNKRNMLVVGASPAPAPAALYLPEYLPTAANGDPISRWVDVSGNNHDLVQATATKQPTRQTRGGKPVARFDGSNDELIMSTGVTLVQDWTAFVVHQTTGDGMLLGGHDPTSRQLMRIGRTGANVLSAYNQTGTEQISTALDTPRANWGVSVVKCTAGTIAFYDGLTAKGGGVTNALSWQFFSIVGSLHASGTPSLFLNGDIWMIRLHDVALADADRIAVTQEMLNDMPTS